MKKIIITTIIGAALLFGASSASAYSVKTGDTLGQIASTHNASLQDVIAANPQIGNPNVIVPNQNINLPNEKSIEAKPASVDGIPMNASERDLIARLVRAEAESESFEGKTAVAVTVFNRMLSDEFPNTVSGVIYQKNQFSPVDNGSINRAATQEDFHAVDEAIGYVERGQMKGVVFFYNSKIASSRWLDSRPTVTIIGNHVFKK